MSEQLRIYQFNARGNASCYFATLNEAREMMARLKLKYIEKDLNIDCLTIVEVVTTLTKENLLMALNGSSVYGAFSIIVKGSDEMI